MNPLLPVCLSVAILGLVVAIVLFLRGRKARAAQAIGVSALSVGLYLTGLLKLVVEAGAALARWGTQLVFNPIVWTGFGFVGLAVVLWVVGGLVARRTRGRARVEKAPQQPNLTAGPLAGRKPSGATKAPAGVGAGDEFDEIEDLLRKRGIE